jgi:hypothetical protein
MHNVIAYDVEVVLHLEKKGRVSTTYNARGKIMMI